MTSWPPPPLRRILIIRNICPPPSPSYTNRGIRSYQRRLLLQQRLLQQLIRLLGADYMVSTTIENYPDEPQILTLGQLLERSWIFEGDLRLVVSSRRNHLYVGGLTLLSSDWCVTLALSKITLVYCSIIILEPTPILHNWKILVPAPSHSFDWTKHWGCPPTRLEW